MIESVLALATLIVASITDLHKRVVPTAVYATGFIAGATLAVYQALVLGSWAVLLNWVWGVALMALVATILYRTKAWGGGDAKLLIALGSILGFAASVPYLLSMSLVGIGYVLCCKVYELYFKRKPASFGEVSPESKFPFVPAMLLAEVVRWYV